MVFSSLIFIFGFLPLTLLCYYVLPRAWRNPVLFVLSLLFYGWGEPVYVLLMVLSITAAYFFAFFIEKYRETAPQKAKRAMVLSLAFSLSLLLFFKYYGFLTENLQRLPLIHFSFPQAPKLPIGISFYTFQVMSYTIDVYRRDCSLQKNYVSFGTYVVLFPQLIAGPIVRYYDIDDQLSERRESVELFADGVRRFCCGLAKKVLLGDLLYAGYEYYKTLQETSASVLGAWMTVLLFTLHLYFDFSGYSDMAIGLGKLFGFRFPENFNYPYISKSITEFWRRWHISLSTWFREYVYIPLGGNRHGLAKQIRNLAIVWLLTGFWHGANWNFLLWGAYFAVILIAEKCFLLRLLERLPAAVRHLYTVLLVLIGFLIFSYTDLSAGRNCLAAMFGFGVVGWSTSVASYQFLRLLPLLAIAVVGSTPFPKRMLEKLCQKHPWLTLPVTILGAGVVLLCVAYLVDSTFSPFAYTQF